MIRKNAALLLAAIIALTLAGCGKESSVSKADNEEVMLSSAASDNGYTFPEAIPAEEGAPAAVDVKWSVRNEGTEEKQYMLFTVTFDDEIKSLDPEMICAVHIGNNVSPDRITTCCNGTDATISIRIDALKMGTVQISYIGSEAQHFTIKGTVSTGAEVTRISSDEASGTAAFKYTHMWDVRGITQLQLVENGEVIPTQDEEQSLTAVIHGHDFLKMTPSMAAEKTAAVLSEVYPEGYEFIWNDDTVVISVTDGREADLDLRVFSEITLIQE